MNIMDMYENLKKDLDPNRIKVENCSHSFVVERSHGSKTGDYVCPSCGATMCSTDYEKYKSTGVLPSHLRN
ncbi:hypothetical protein D357_02023 [Enterococcus faecium SD3B-2]|nr:hypothetical protein D357_02023 [Enterococcus faecium SD3B-2]